MPKIDKLLKIAAEHNASDLHYNVGAPPLIRIDGELFYLDHPIISYEVGEETLMEIMTNEQISKFEQQLEYDFAYMADDIGRFRVTVFNQQHGISGVFRLIPEQILSLDDLNLPEALYSLTELNSGLVLITGATGSGKTTTLASLTDIINRKKKKHILTIEDPIEFIHTNKNCIITQREVGMETESFAKALRSGGRQDVDIIIVGEMRDLETITLTLNAAETGSLVFATIHTNSAVKTVDRIIDVFPESEQNHIRYVLAATIKGVVSQQLLPMKNGKGRVPAVEIMMGTPAIGNVIREGKTHQLTSLIQGGRKDSMQTMDQSLIDLVKKGFIHHDLAYHRLQDKGVLSRV